MSRNADAERRRRLRAANPLIIQCRNWHEAEVPFRDLYTITGPVPTRDPSCGICLDPIDDNRRAFVHLTCMTAYHRACLGEHLRHTWIRTSDVRCPSCRGKLERGMAQEMETMRNERVMLQRISRDIKARFAIVKTDLKDELYRRIDRIRSDIEDTMQTDTCIGLESGIYRGQVENRAYQLNVHVETLLRDHLNQMMVRDLTPEDHGWWRTELAAAVDPLSSDDDDSDADTDHHMHDH